MINMNDTTTKYALYEVIDDGVMYEKLLRIYDEFSDAKIVAVSLAKSDRRMKIREFVTEMLDEI